MAATYEPIASQTLGSAASSVTFSDIPGTYTDLIIVFSGTGASNTNLYLRFNGDSGSNYSRTYLYGDGSSAISGRESSQTFWYGAYAATSSSMAVMTLMSYSNSNVYKTCLTASAMPSLVSGTRIVGLWRSTSAITSVVITGESANIASGSIFSLFGVKAA